LKLKLLARLEQTHNKKKEQHSTMGRVARYKKVKSCDPFAKGGGIMVDVWGEGNNGRVAKKRSRTSEKLRFNRKRKGTEEVRDGFDEPPGEDEFDMNDLVGSLKKQEVVNLLKEEDNVEKVKEIGVEKPSIKAPTTEVAANPKHALSLADDLKEAKILKIDPNKKEATTVAGRMEGESKKAFYRRMKSETKRAIRDESIIDNTNPEKKQRKKDFMKAKKQKKRKGGSAGYDDEDGQRYDDDDDDLDILMTGERAVQQIAFSNQTQVERPPTFHILPRGCTPKKAKAQIAFKPNTGMSHEQQHAEQRSMEKMREKVQARYAIMKAQRKKDHDFHL
jgi:hypothetical protein